MRRFAVGADYSSKAVHLALVGPDKVEAHGIVDFRDQSDAAALHQLRVALDGWSHWIAGRKDAGMVCLVLEDPWLRAESGVRSALSIHRIANFTECVAIQAGYRVHRVPVPTWRSQVFGRQMRTGQAKRASLDYARTVFGVHTSDNNLADAICLGSYGQRAVRIGEAVLA